MQHCSATLDPEPYTLLCPLPPRGGGAAPQGGIIRPVASPAGKQSCPPPDHQPCEVTQIVGWNLNHSTLEAPRIRGAVKVNRRCSRALFEPPPRAGGRGGGVTQPLRCYLTKSVYKVVLQKSIPAQIRQCIVYYDLCMKDMLTGLCRN